MSSPNPTYDRSDLTKAVGLFLRPDGIVELRAPRTPKMGTVSGYFDFSHQKELIDCACDLSGVAPGVYFTLNDCHPDLLARAKNKIIKYAQHTTKDDEITRRRWILLDFDPVRMSGISATDEEHEAAIKRARDVRDYLRTLGFPDPILIDSGNGAHLYYACDLPNEPSITILIKAFLQALSNKFSNKLVNLDTSVANAARISKLPGTLAAKGSSTPDRPHRIARILEIPSDIRPVPSELLQSVAPQSQSTMSFRTIVQSLRPGTTFKEWADAHQIAIVSEKLWGNDGTLCVLASCPFDPSHTNQSAYVIQFPNGRIFAKCHHQSCLGKGWKEFRDAVEPGWRDRGDSLHLGLVPKEQIDDPHRLAWHCLAKYIHQDGLLLVRYQNAWYFWNGLIWTIIDQHQLENEVSRVSKEEFDKASIEEQAKGNSDKANAKKVTTILIGNVLNALRSLVLTIPSDAAVPQWIYGDGPWPAKETAVARNGLVNLLKLSKKQPDFHLPHTPCLFSTMGLSFDVTMDVAKPVHWFRFLDSLWSDDPESIQALREWFGAAISGELSHQKMLMIIGAPRSGKGTIEQVIRQIVGRDNFAAMSLSMFASEFGMQLLLGKKLAIVSDARLGNRSDLAIITERLLSISGGDPQAVNAKFKAIITTDLKVMIWILGNELLRLPDSSGAIASRFIVIRTTRGFLGSEDKGLLERLLTELPAIFHWSVEGWARLREAGKFSQPASGQELLNSLDEMTSPIRYFLRECVEEGASFSVGCDELCKAYQNWAEENGHESFTSIEQFAKALHAAVPGLKKRQPRRGGKRVRV